MNVKPTRAIGDYCRGFATEDGKNYRVERQDIAPTLDHVKFLSEKVNTAPKSATKTSGHTWGRSQSWSCQIGSRIITTPGISTPGMRTSLKKSF